jgi:hypothetical protein
VHSECMVSVRWTNLSTTGSDGHSLAGSRLGNPTGDAPSLYLQCIGSVVSIVSAVVSIGHDVLCHVLRTCKAHKLI